MNENQKTRKEKLNGKKISKTEKVKMFNLQINKKNKIMANTKIKIFEKLSQT